MALSESLFKFLAARFHVPSDTLDYFSASAHIGRRAETALPFPAELIPIGARLVLRASAPVGRPGDTGGMIVVPLPVVPLEVVVPVLVPLEVVVPVLVPLEVVVPVVVPLEVSPAVPLVVVLDEVLVPEEVELPLVVLPPVELAVPVEPPELELVLVPDVVLVQAARRARTTESCQYRTSDWPIRASSNPPRPMRVKRVK